MCNRIFTQANLRKLTLGQVVLWTQRWIGGSKSLGCDLASVRATELSHP